MTDKYALRGYQKDAVAALISDIDNGKKSTSAVLPTGSGKTLILIDIIDKLRGRLSLRDSIYVLCHLSDPLYQLVNEYKEKGERPGRIELWKKAIHSNSMSVDTIFGTIQKVSRSLGYLKSRKKQKMLRQPKYIIIDEAHAVGTKSYADLAKTFPDAVLIGLSATPFRSNKYSFGQFENVAYTISMGALIDMGFLVKPNLSQIDLKDQSDDPGRVALSYKIWKEKEKNRGLVTVIFFPTTELAKNALAAMKDKARCRYMDGKSKLGEVKEIISSAKEGKIDILLNCQKLETGIDIPSIGSVIMPYKCGSVARYIQRVGRGLRLYPGKAQCNVYLYGDTPSIERGEWLNIHNLALNIKKPLPSEDLQTDLDDLMETGGRLLIKWTEEAIEACRRLEGIGHLKLAEFIAKKRYPKKYDNYLGEIMNGARTTPKDNEPITSLQSYMLTDQFGFSESVVSKMTKSEAKTLLSGFKGWLERDPWIIQEGPYIGRHPSQIPGLYKNHCKNPSVVKLLREWYRHGRPALILNKDLDSSRPG